MGPSAAGPEASRPASGLSALPQRQGLGDDVYEAVKRSIMDHDIAPGARMSIDGLARDLGVSQTPIREALARLESDGLVTRTALKGYSASPVLSHGEVVALFGLRALLEPWAAGEAAARVSAESAAAVRAEMESIARAPEGSTYEVYKALTAHDARFHDLLLRLAGNEAVRLAIARTHCHLHIFRLTYDGGQGGEALREHRRIADAVLAGDPAAASAAMAAHLEVSKARLMEVAR